MKLRTLRPEIAVLQTGVARVGGLAAMLGALCLFVGCATTPPVFSEGPGSSARGGVTLLSPRCAKVQSCVLGHVTTAENGRPLSHAAVFLELEGEQSEQATSGKWILALTDDHGVFEIENPPPGRYRLSVFAPPREINITGVELGEHGTTMVPVRLPMAAL